MTFRIYATTMQSGLVRLYIPRLAIDSFITGDEWEAFRSLLVPSSKADFVIEELTERKTHEHF